MDGHVAQCYGWQMTPVSAWGERMPVSYVQRVLRAAIAAILLFSAAVLADDKPRLFVLTDIGGDPDDKMSMVRLLVYANHFDIEGLVATSVNDAVNPQLIEKVVSAYGKVRDNLERHEPGFPPADHLRERISYGPVVDGVDGVGEGMDSPGSELLIRTVDRDDPRPVWVNVWGGPSVLAQALWKVRETRSPDEVDAFVAKLRVYAISDQDNSGPWIRKHFPGLFYIVTPGINAGGGFQLQVGQALEEGLHQAFLATEQMGAAGDIQQQAVVPIAGRPWREPPGPALQRLQQCPLAGRVLRQGDEGGTGAAAFGKAHPRAQAGSGSRGADAGQAPGALFLAGDGKGCLIDRDPGPGVAVHRQARQ